jgi:ribosomal-protein-alanine N-acetyltransferase
LKKIIEFGFNEIKLNSIEAYTHSKNEVSKKLLQKYNFKLDAGRVDKENMDNIIFTLSK